MPKIPQKSAVARPASIDLEDDAPPVLHRRIADRTKTMSTRNTALSSDPRPSRPSFRLKPGVVAAWVALGLSAGAETMAADTERLAQAPGKAPAETTAARPARPVAPQAAPATPATTSALGAPPPIPPGMAVPDPAAIPVPNPAALVVPTLAELAGRPVLDLKDDLGAAAAFDRLGTAGLAQTVERALSGSFDVAAAAARTQAQRELVDVARGGLLPKMDLRANIGRELSKPGSVIDETTGLPVSRSLHTRDDTALVFRQAIWDGPAAGEFARQRALYQAALAGLGSARDQLALDAANAYLDLLQYRLQLQFARDYRIGLEKLYAFVERRSQGGGSSAAEAERVKARAINARSTVIEAQGALESALVSYRRLVGGVPDAVRTDDAGGARDLPSLDAALALAKVDNPSIVQLRETLNSIQAEERAARSKLYPKFEMEVGNYRTTNAGGRPGTTDDTRAMLVMNWNFLAGGADLAQLRSVKAREDETKFRILDVERRLDEALRVTYNTLDAVTQRAGAVRDELISNERVVAAFEEQLVLANRPLLDVLDAQQRLFQSRAELLRLTALQANLSLQVRRQLGKLAPAGPGFREAPPTRSDGYNIPKLPAPGRSGR
jgi:adhesin transport system outer membrane protein